MFASGYSSEPNVKRPVVVEAALKHEEMRRALKGTVAPGLMFFLQLFLPQRQEFLIANALSFMIILTAGAFNAWVLSQKATGERLQNLHFWNDAAHHTCRTAGHLVWIMLGNEDLMSRMIFLFIAPCNAVRISRHASFIIYMALHACLIIIRFMGRYMEEMPFLIAGLACTQILYEFSVMKKRSEETAVEKAWSMVSLIEETTERAFDCFCDASLRITQDLKIVEQSQSMCAFLQRRCHSGRNFLDFIYNGDKAAYTAFFQRSFSESEHYETVAAEGMQGMKVKTIAIRLEDSMGSPIQANVFHVCFETWDGRLEYLVGISELEAFKHDQNRVGKTRTRKAAAAATGKVEPGSSRFESGRLQPSRPPVGEKDSVSMSTLGASRQRSGSADMNLYPQQTLERGQIGPPQPSRNLESDALTRRNVSSQPF